MGLYTGFNALGLGIMAAQNDERRRAHNSNILELLRNFGNSAAERLKENRQRDEALATARALGIDNAEGLSKGMDYADFARFVQGVASAKENEKISDARQQKQWGHEDIVRSDERRYNEGQEAKKRSQEALDKGFATLSQAYLADITKFRDNILPSQKELDESARIKGDLMNFVKEHPEYGIQLATALMQSGEGDKSGKPVTFDNYLARLKGLKSTDDKGNDIVDSKAMGELYDDLVENGLWSYLKENRPEFTDLWDNYMTMIPEGKLSRNVKMFGSGEVNTREDARNAKDKADTEALIAAEIKKLLAARKAKKKFDFSTLKKTGWYKKNRNSTKWKGIIDEMENGYGGI